MVLLRPDDAGHSSIVYRPHQHPTRICDVGKKFKLSRSNAVRFMRQPSEWWIAAGLTAILIFGFAWMVCLIKADALLHANNEEYWPRSLHSEDAAPCPAKVALNSHSIKSRSRA
ncbi:hypothetical protein XAP412_430004 [Xanthomonas phaseoli pv. phaseoli]|nr:hypothetical protein XAP412_430004 [Xanthomonas phaseoli pv. phaseoli]